MNATTTDITNALDALEEACSVLVYEHDHPHYSDTALSVLATAGSLMENYTCDYFSEEEVTFICDAMICAIESLRDVITEDGNEELI